MLFRIGLVVFTTRPETLSPLGRNWWEYKHEGRLRWWRYRWPHVFDFRTWIWTAPVAIFIFQHMTLAQLEFLGHLTFSSGVATAGNSGELMIGSGTSTGGKAGSISITVQSGDTGDGGMLTVEGGKTTSTERHLMVGTYSLLQGKIL